MRYIGYIDYTANKYCNFYPVLYFEEGKWNTIDYDQARRDFPEFGNINLQSERYKSLDYLKNYFFDKHYYMLDFTDDLFKPNYSNGEYGELRTTNYKLVIDKFIGTKKYAPIDKIEEGKLYFVYEIKANINDIDFNNIILNDEFIKDDKVLLKIKNVNNEEVFIGPFNVEINENDEYYINAQPEKNNYIYDTYIIGEDQIAKKRITIRWRFDSEVQELHHKNLIIIDNDFTKKEQDYISEKKLFEKFNRYLEASKYKGQISTDNIDLLIEDIEGSTSSIICYGKKQFTENRIKKLLDVLEELQVVDEDISLISKIISNSLEREATKNVVLYEKLTQSIFENEDLLNRVLPQLKFSKDEINRLNEEKNMLEKSIDSLKHEKDRLNEEAQKEVYGKIQKLKEENEYYNVELEKKKTELEDLRNKLGLTMSYDNLYGAVDYLRNEEVSIKEKNNKLKKQGEEALQNIKTQMKSLTDTLATTITNSIVDDYISQTIIEASNKKNNDETMEEYKLLVESISNIEVNNMQGQDLIKYLTDNILEYRSQYSKNDILNILICVTQGFLTVFSGEPGTGKSSICNIIGHVLGLDGIRQHKEFKNYYNDINPNRYIPISVEKGWTSKRDLIGYYNPLTKNFDSAGNCLYQSLKILDIEKKLNQSKLPLLVLLDEANLSSMEYYWADFMNLADENLETSCIDLGNGEAINITNSLRFVATINNDHTTEMLSPRLIDRAWVITLPNVKMDLDNFSELNFKDYLKPIVWDNMINLFNNRNCFELSQSIKEILTEVLKKFNAANISISPRVYKAIVRYCLIAQTIFDGVDDTERALLAADYVIAQKLLPKINCNGNISLSNSTYKIFKDFIDDLYKYCKEQNLKRSQEILDKIIQRGNAAMEYYSFFKV